MKIENSAAIGNAVINDKDPHALTERIRFLVHHEHSYVAEREALERLVAEGHRNPYWTPYQKFLELLREYDEMLETGAFSIEDERRRVENFDLHLTAVQEPS